LAPGRDIFSSRIADLMTPSPHAVAENRLAADAARLMQEKSIGQLAVIDDSGNIGGALTMHDLMRGKVL
jgi:arabinose-5-phosphate isomerase